MLGCLEVVEYSLKERFNMTYLHQVLYLRLQDVIGVCLSYYPVQHQVSYLRLQDVIGVCLSYYCLSGVTCVLAVSYTHLTLPTIYSV